MLAEGMESFKVRFEHETRGLPKVSGYFSREETPPTEFLILFFNNPLESVTTVLYIVRF